MRMANFVSQFMFKHIIVCSDSLFDWVRKTHKISKNKLKVMYNCVDLEKFMPVKEKNLQAYLNFDQPLPKYCFITVGSLGKGNNKRIDISIQAIAQLRKNNVDAGLIICGDGELKQDLMSLVQNLEIEENIYFLGIRKDVERIMPHAFAYLHSAAYEPFGIVCIEAMASGLPVIIPNSGGIKDIITNNIEGYIYSSLNPDDMAAKMLKIVSEEKNYSNMKMAALTNVRKFGVDIYVNKLYKLYNE